MARVTYMTNLVVRILFVISGFVFILDVLVPLDGWSAEDQIKNPSYLEDVKESFYLVLGLTFSGLLLKILHQIELNTRKDE